MEEHGFTLEKQQRIAEYDTEAYLYRHRTGARLLSLVNADENKVFGANFRTPPDDSTGIAHILEHAVLCGSRKYPVKEPFVELLKGSLKTFLNAFTYPDKTCYPVASQNAQDFYNLIDVYLDAVFHPRLTPQVLQQEGWHYEPEGDRLVFKGVVFNEMKGAYSSPEQLGMRYAHQALFPDTTYGFDSGGDPRCIPDLTWEQFEAFHRDNYHPANAWLYFYGDDDPAARLRILAAYLDEFEPRRVDSSIGLQERWSRPRRCVFPYAADEDGQAKSLVTLNWLIGEGLDPQEVLGLEILEHVLVGTPAAPLRKALIESGLGEEMTGYGLESESLQLSFSTGLKGVEQAREEDAERLILEQLERLAAAGLDTETVRASVNTCEFRLRENNTGSYPRGLLLMLRALSPWVYDGDPLESLQFEAALDGIKSSLDKGGYFEGLIRRHLLDNSHRATVVLRPDPKLAARQEAEERARLDAARAALSAADVERVARQAQELKARQEAPDRPEDLALLPRLGLDDLEKSVRTVSVEKEVRGPSTVLHHDLFTNGICYADMAFDMRGLPRDLLPLVPLFGRALTEMGTEEEDFVRLAQRIGSRTGGVWAQPLLTTHRNGTDIVARLVLRGKAMTGQLSELLAVMRDVLLKLRLDDRERFLQMVLEEKAGEEAGLVPGGHAVVALRLRAKLGAAAAVTEQMEGIDYLFSLRRLVDEVRDDWPAVQERLERIRQILVNGRGLLCNATLAGEDRPLFEAELDAFLADLPAFEPVSESWATQTAGGAEGLVLPAQVNYVGKGGNLFDAGYRPHGSSQVIARYLRTSWLWDRVRVQGGAYGAMCSFDPFTGIWTYASYRDPNLLETLANYDGTGGFLQRVALDEDELTKAIIGAIGEADSYQLPDAKGYTSMMRHLVGVDDAYRQQRRDEVLGTTVEHFREFGAYLEALAADGVVVVMGGQDALEAVREGLGLELRRVL